MSWKYDNVQVVKIVDGDTIDCKVTVDIGFKVQAVTIQRFRLMGIDAPETRGLERPKGLESKEYVINKITESDNTVSLETFKDDAFGRWLAKVTLVDGTDLGQLMLDEGQAEIYKKK